jgi:hypothetical protein
MYRKIKEQQSFYRMIVISYFSQMSRRLNKQDLIIALISFLIRQFYDQKSSSHSDEFNIMQFNMIMLWHHPLPK